MSKENQYVPSITLGELATNIAEIRFKHPEWKDKQIYFDCLHILGKVEENGEYLELI